MATHFVPTEEIQKLTLDSYEFLATKIDEAIAKDAKKVFGESIPNKIERIGTFSDHVLLAADDGRFVAVSYERGSNGSIKIVKSESVSVPLYTEANIDSYLMQEARSIVDSILAHDSTTVEMKMKALSPFVDGAKPQTEEQKVESVLAAIGADRPWKKLYKERQEQVSKFLGDSLKDIESKKLTSKFSKMEEKSITEDLVRSDLAFMLESVGGYRKLTDSIGDLKDIQATVSGEERAAIVTFGAFVEDLRIDLKDVLEAISEYSKSIKSVVCLGRLYDALAEESFNYDVASRFAATMSASLRESK